MRRFSRRDFLGSGGLAVAGSALGLRSSRAVEPASDGISVGILADPHYADREPKIGRHFRDSLGKIEEFVRTMSEAKPDFAIVLGDYTDQRGGADEKAADLKRIEEVYRKLRVPRHYVIGNHDVDLFTKEQFLAATGVPGAHHSFDAGPFHCVVLDANYRKDFSPYRAGNFDWMDTWVPPEEQKWLEADLKAAAKKTLVFVHQCLDDEGGPHGVKNAPDVRRILEGSRSVLAVFQGHNHRGAFRQIKGIPYVTLRAMVEGPGPDSNAYALLRVSADGSLTLRGYGKQPSRGL